MSVGLGADVAPVRAVLMETARQLLTLVSEEVKKHQGELDSLEEDLAQAMDESSAGLHRPAWPGEALLRASVRESA